MLHIRTSSPFNYRYRATTCRRLVTLASGPSSKGFGESDPGQAPDSNPNVKVSEWNVIKQIETDLHDMGVVGHGWAGERSRQDLYETRPCFAQIYQGATAGATTSLRIGSGEERGHRSDAGAASDEQVTALFARQYWERQQRCLFLLQWSQPFGVDPSGRRRPDVHPDGHLCGPAYCLWASHARRVLLPEDA